MRLGKSVFKKLIIICLLLLALTSANGLVEPQTVQAVAGYQRSYYTFFSDSSLTKCVGTIQCDACECIIKGEQTQYFTVRTVNIQGVCP